MTAIAGVVNKDIGRNSVRRKKRSKAYTATVILIVYMVYSYLWPVYLGEAAESVLILDILLSYIPRLAIILFFGILLFQKRLDGGLKKSALLLSAFTVTAIISFAIAHSGLTRLIGFVFIGVLLMFYSKYGISRWELRRLYRYVILASVIVIWNSASLKTYRAGDQGINPNTVAFMLTMIYCVSLIYFGTYKKLAYLSAAAVCVALQFVYGSRTALFGILLFTIALVVFKGFRRTFSRRTVAIVLFTIAALGILIAYIYSYTLYDAYGRGAIFIFGKDIFTGRQAIWRRIFESLKQNLWFGVGSNINSEFFVAGASDLSGVMNNAHNQSLGALATFGLAPAILFYLFIAQLISSRYRVDNLNRVLALFFGTILVMSCFEAYFFSMLSYPIILVGYALIYNLSQRSISQGGRVLR